MSLLVPLILAFVISVLGSALFSGLETGLYTTSRLRLYLDAEAGVSQAIRARALLRSMPRLLAVLLVANNIANYGASLSAQLLLREIDVASPELWGTIAVTPVLFLLAESVPKAAFITAREALLYPVMPVLSVTHRVLAPIVSPIAWLATWLARALARGGGVKPHGDEVFASGTAEGLLTPFQERVAQGILSMRSRSASDEAARASEWPTAQLGAAGVRMPAGHREHRVLIVEGVDARVVGWMPLAELVDGRVPERRDLRPVARVGRGARLDRVYASLDEAAAAFAVLPDGRVIAAHRLRQRIMGTFHGEGQRDVATASKAP